MGVKTWLLGCALGLVAVPAQARDSEASKSPAGFEGSVFLDPLGFALFGPRLGIEAGTSNLSLGVSARWFDGGLLSHALFLSNGDKFGFSYGLALRGRYYFADRQAGFHAGVGAEYLHTRIETPSVQVAALSNYLVPQLEGGYRFVLGRFYADGVVGAGYAIKLGTNVEDIGGGDNARFYTVSDESRFYASAALELGVRF